MAKIVNLKDNAGAIVYPVTKTNAVYDESGNNVSELCPTKDEKEFLSNEYNKSVNLINSSKIFKINLGQRYIDFIVDLEPNTNYTISIDKITLVDGTCSRNASLVEAYNFKDNIKKNFTFPYNTKTSYTFNSSNYDTIRIYACDNWTSSESVSINVDSLMLVKGDKVPNQFKLYNGPIIHKKDITPVVLWKNGETNINNELLETSITIDNVLKYKPIEVYYEQPYGINGRKWGTESKRFILDDNNKIMMLNTQFVSSSGTTEASRIIELKSINGDKCTLLIYQGVLDNTINNICCKPKLILGYKEE